MKWALLNHSPFSVTYWVLNNKSIRIYFFYFEHKFAHLKSCDHAK